MNQTHSDNMENSTTVPRAAAPQQLSDFEEFNMSMEMYPIHTFIFIIAGFIGNFFALTVILRKNLRNSSTAVFISTLAIADSIALLGFLLGMISLIYVPHIISPGFCMAYFFILSTGSQISTWTILAMTFERMIFVVYPFFSGRMPEFNTRKHMTLVISAEVVITIMLVLHNIHFFWTTAATPAGCNYNNVHHGEFLKHWSVYDACISAYIPLLSILIMNGINIALICANKSTINQETDPKKRKKWKRANKVTVMLLSISIAFFILMTPYAIFQVYIYYIIDLSTITVEHLAKISLANQFCTMFWEINHGINFILYAMTRKKFRKEIVYIFWDVIKVLIMIFCNNIGRGSSYDFTKSAHDNKTKRMTETSVAEPNKTEMETEMHSNGHI